MVCFRFLFCLDETDTMHQRCSTVSVQAMYMVTKFELVEVVTCRIQKKKFNSRSAQEGNGIILGPYP